MTTDRNESKDGSIEAFARALVDLQRRLHNLEADSSLSIKEFSLKLTVSTPGGDVDAEVRCGGERGQQLPSIPDTLYFRYLRVARPSYDTLKSKYKCEEKEHTCSLDVEHSCAIRMSEALLAVDSSWAKVFKESGKNLCDNKSVRGAQDLAAILESTAGFGTHDAGKDDPGGQIPASIKDKRGIIIYMGIPGYSGQGHIGLWNKTTGECGEAYWDAKRVWFWELQ